MFDWIKSHIILTVAGVVGVIVVFILVRAAGSSSSDASQAQVSYDGGLDPQTATAEVQAQAALQGMQYQAAAQQSQTAGALQYNQDTIAGQISLAQLQAQSLDTQNELAAQIASQNISAQESVAENTNSTQVALAQTSAKQAVDLANVNAGVINNQTGALVQMAGLNAQTQQAAINANSGPCYITTVVCEVLGLPDDCYYLTRLRWFRDNWLLHLHPADWSEYKRTAPALCEHIRDQKDKDEFCTMLFTHYILPSVGMIDCKRYDFAHSLYRSMVERCREIS